MSSARATVLREAAAARSLGAAERARRALVDLDRQGETITFVGVAARASVSRQFLYSQPDLRAEIERLRGQQQRAPARLSVRERASDESIRFRLSAALDENKRSREELAALREELALAHGRVRELELATRAVSAARTTSTGPPDTLCRPGGAFHRRGPPLNLLPLHKEPVAPMSMARPLSDASQSARGLSKRGLAARVCAHARA